MKGEERMNIKNIELISITEVCERLNISRNTAYSLLKRGELEGYKVGRMWRIPDKSIWNYIMLSNKRREVVNHEEENNQ